MMSDLAPFVAAVLRDGVIEDLQAEVVALRAENAKQQAGLVLCRSPFAITGAGGSPIFVKEDDLPDNGPSRLRLVTGHPVHVDFHTGNEITPCTLSDLRDSHIYLHGHEICLLYRRNNLRFSLSVEQDGRTEVEMQDADVLERYIFRRSFSLALGSHLQVLQIQFCIQDYLSKEMCLDLAGITDFMTNPRDLEVEKPVSLDALIALYDDGEDAEICFTSYAKG